MTSINHFTYFSPQRVSFKKVSITVKSQEYPVLYPRTVFSFFQQVKPEFVEVLEEGHLGVPEVHDGNETVRSHTDAAESIKFSSSRTVGAKLLEKDARRGENLQMSQMIVMNLDGCHYKTYLNSVVS